MYIGLVQVGTRKISTVWLAIRALLYVIGGTPVVRVYLDRYVVVVRLSTGFELWTTCPSAA